MARHRDLAVAAAGIALLALSLPLVVPDRNGGQDGQAQATASPTSAQEPTDPPSPSSSETATSPEPRRAVFQVMVPATQPWTDSGRDLVPGDRVTITATGQIDDNTQEPASPRYGPDGMADTAGQHPGDPHPGMNHAALVAKVGETGDPVEVGEAATFSPDHAGRLLLGVNDGRFDDNAGSYTAEVTVTRPASAGAEPPG